MKRVRPVFISHNPYRSPKAKLRSKQIQRKIDTDTHDRISESQISESQILVGLGLLASLLLFGGIQLFRSINASTNHIEPMSATSTLTFDLEDSTSVAPTVEIDMLTRSQKTEMLTIQNTISNGNF